MASWIMVCFVASSNCCAASASGDQRDTGRAQARARTDDRVRKVLLRALALRGEERGDRAARERAADLAGARGRELVDDGRVLLPEAARVEAERAAGALHPALAAEHLRGERDEEDEGGLREHGRLSVWGGVYEGSEGQRRARRRKCRSTTGGGKEWKG
jgi:hypothetical protein